MVFDSKIEHIIRKFEGLKDNCEKLQATEKMKRKTSIFDSDFGDFNSFNGQKSSYDDHHFSSLPLSFGDGKDSLQSENIFDETTNESTTSLAKFFIEDHKPQSKTMIEESKKEDSDLRWEELQQSTRMFYFSLFRVMSEVPFNVLNIILIMKTLYIILPKVIDILTALIIYILYRAISFD